MKVGSVIRKREPCRDLGRSMQGREDICPGGEIITLLRDQAMCLEHRGQKTESM